MASELHGGLLVHSGSTLNDSVTIVGGLDVTGDAEINNELKVVSAGAGSDITIENGNIIYDAYQTVGITISPLASGVTTGAYDNTITSIRTRIDNGGVANWTLNIPEDFWIDEISVQVTIAGANLNIALLRKEWDSVTANTVATVNPSATGIANMVCDHYTQPGSSYILYASSNADNNYIGGGIIMGGAYKVGVGRS